MLTNWLVRLRIRPLRVREFLELCPGLFAGCGHEILLTHHERVLDCLTRVDAFEQFGSGLDRDHVIAVETIKSCQAT